MTATSGPNENLKHVFFLIMPEQFTIHVEGLVNADPLAWDSFLSYSSLIDCNLNIQPDYLNNLLELR